MAIGAAFSALEVVPLVRIGLEAFHTPAAGGALDAEVPLADPLPRRRGVLEPQHRPGAVVGLSLLPIGILQALASWSYEPSTVTTGAGGVLSGRTVPAR